MKHFSPGLSDSIASVIADPPQCPHCDSSSQIVDGLCVGCLLQTGLDPDDECAPETLVSALAEITLPDKNWRLGNYEILEEIGRGGMGVIYRARQRHSRRIVAVKRVLGYHADSRETLARFRREAQAAASLDHPNILPIYEVSESEDGLPFFSMKFAPGGSLQEVGPALRNDPRQCVALVAKIARAVQHAHGKGILHRDLKPGNILLDAHGEPLVSDFGLAKWLDTTSDLTRTLTIFGTPGYIAPEQASGPAAQLKPAADVYSLGAILFDLLAGRPPFLGSHALSVIRQAAESPAPKLRTLSKLADRDLETICARCLERDPSLRYRSAYDLAEDLERWLEGRPIIARSVSPAVKLWRWSKRNRMIAAALAIIAGLTLLGLVGEFKRVRLTRDAQRESAFQHSVAILPFLDLDVAAPDPVLGAIVNKGLKPAMTRLGPSRVVSLVDIPEHVAGGGAIADLRKAGQHADTRSVLTGTKREVGGKFHTVIRLLNPATGEILFSRSFEFAGSPLPESESLEKAADAIWSILSAPDLSNVAIASRDPGMKNEVARDLIVAGRDLYFRYTVADLDRAITCLEKAVTMEPGSAIAHAYLAAALGGRSHYGSAPGLLDRAELEVHEALRLDPDSVDAHRTLAGVTARRNRTKEALEEYLRAVELGGPEERVAILIARTYANLGRPDRAIVWTKLARHWETRRGEADSALGDYWTELCVDGEAEEAYRRGAELHPELPAGWLGLCRLRLLQGNYEKAREMYSNHFREFSSFNEQRQMLAQIEFFSRRFPEAEHLYADLAASDENGGGDFYGGISYRSALGWLSLSKGDDESARQMLERCLANENEINSAAPNNPNVLYRLAAIESSLGHQEAALKHLRAAVENGWLDYRSAILDPRFDRYSREPQFENILGLAKDRTANLRQLIPRIGK